MQRINNTNAIRIMKKTIITMLLATLTLGATAQTANDMPIANEAKTQNDSVRTAPAFPSGLEGLAKYMKKNVKYPREADQYGVEGSVVMTFTVTKDGTITNIEATDCKLERFNTTKFSQETPARQAQLKERFALLFAKEGARVIRKMPKWQPGTLNGQPVDAKLHQRIKFLEPYK